MASGDRASTSRKQKNAIKDRDEKSQSERFVDTARELGADESGEAFEVAIKKIALSKNPS